MGRVRAVPCLCELYPGICLTTEENARKNLSQGNLYDTEKIVCWRQGLESGTLINVDPRTTQLVASRYTDRAIPARKVEVPLRLI